MASIAEGTRLSKGVAGRPAYGSWPSPVQSARHSILNPEIMVKPCTASSLVLLLTRNVTKPAYNHQIAALSKHWGGSSQDALDI